MTNHVGLLSLILFFVHRCFADEMLHPLQCEGKPPARYKDVVFIG